MRNQDLPKNYDNWQGKIFTNLNNKSPNSQSASKTDLWSLKYNFLTVKNSHESSGFKLGCKKITKSCILIKNKLLVQNRGNIKVESARRKIEATQSKARGSENAQHEENQ